MAESLVWHTPDNNPKSINIVVTKKPALILENGTRVEIKIRVINTWESGDGSVNKNRIEVTFPDGKVLKSSEVTYYKLRNTGLGTIPWKAYKEDLKFTELNSEVLVKNEADTIIKVLLIEEPSSP